MVLVRILGVVLGAALSLPCCTTFMRPVVCGDTRFACGEVRDAKFCENVVTSVEGPDCAQAGLSPGKRFCFVSKGPCVHTTYALKDRDCAVREYTPVREWSHCSAGTPTFGR